MPVPGSGDGRSPLDVPDAGVLPAAGCWRQGPGARDLPARVRLAQACPLPGLSGERGPRRENGRVSASAPGGWHMKRPKAAERGLEQILARSGDGVFAVGTEGRVVLWNRAAERILGWSARDVMGRPCCDVFVGVDDHGNRLCYKGCHVMSLVKLGG